jgi:hypothetical protein
MPAEYGIPTSTDGLLDWAHVDERMAAAKHYWLATVTSAGEPRSTPVDGLWIEGRLYFGGSPKTNWNRNLDRNPAASVHLAGTTDVVIMHGSARLTTPSARLAEALASQTADKYGYETKPDDYTGGGVRVFRPNVVLAWTNFPRDCTRWDLAG